jgi:salicylate hydroxylase
MSTSSTNVDSPSERRFSVAIWCVGISLYLNLPIDLTTLIYLLYHSGGGLGGLTLAATLARYCSDVQCDVYEASSWISTAGAGIGTWQRNWRILEHLGLDQGLMEKAMTPPKQGQRAFGVPELRSASLIEHNLIDLALTLRRSDKADGGYNYYDLIAPCKPSSQKMPQRSYTASDGMTPLHRTDLFDALLRSLPTRCSVHTSKRLATYIAPPLTDNSPITLHFTDGSTATTDILIGADGVKSRVRFQMYQDLAETSRDAKPDFMRYQDPMWSGVIAYRSVFPTSDLLEMFPGHPVAKTPTMVSSSVSTLDNSIK